MSTGSSDVPDQYKKFSEVLAEYRKMSAEELTAEWERLVPRTDTEAHVRSATIFAIGMERGLQMLAEMSEEERAKLDHVS